MSEFSSAWNLLLVSASCARSEISVSISCFPCSAESSVNRLSFGNICGEPLESVAFLLADFCLIMKIAPATQRIRAAEQPITIPATVPWLRWERDFEIGELEGFELIGFDVLEDLFDVGSKSSFTAPDVHDGYWLPLKVVRSKIENQLKNKCPYSIL